MQDYMTLCMRIVIHRSVLDDSPVIKLHIIIVVINIPGGDKAVYM